MFVCAAPTAVQEGHGASQAAASAWLRADTARYSTPNSIHEDRYSSSTYTQPSSSQAGASTSASGDEGAGGLQMQVHPVYGYAVLGGVDPNASQLVAGATQPKLHPTRNFQQQDMYDPTVRRGGGCIGVLRRGMQL